MMKSNNELTVVYSKFRKNAPTTLRFSAVISFVVIVLYAFAALILNSIASDTFNYFELLVTIIFIVCLVLLLQPFIYSYFATNIVLNSNSDHQVGMAEFFRGYGIGSRKGLNSLLYIPSNLIYSLLVYFISFIAFTFITWGLLYSFNSSYTNLLNEMMAFAQNSDTAGFNDLINSNASLINPINLVVEFLSTLLGFYYFMHKIGVNIFKYYLLAFAGGTSKRVYHMIFKGTIKDHQKDFYKHYYSVSWIYSVIILVTYSATYFLIYFLNTKSSSFILIALTSIVVSVLFILPFLPILFNLYDEMGERYGTYFISRMRKMLEEQVALLKQNFDSYSAEQKAQVNTYVSYLNAIKRQDELNKAAHKKDEETKKDESKEDEKKNDK